MTLSVSPALVKKVRLVQKPTSCPVGDLARTCWSPGSAGGFGDGKGVCGPRHSWFWARSGPGLKEHHSARRKRDKKESWCKKQKKVGRAVASPGGQWSGDRADGMR